MTTGITNRSSSPSTRILYRFSKAFLMATQAGGCMVPAGFFTDKTLVFFVKNRSFGLFCRKFLCRKIISQSNSRRL